MTRQLFFLLVFVWIGFAKNVKLHLENFCCNLFQPRTSGLSYWLIKLELLVIQALVIGYLGLGYWLLNQELRPENSWFRSWFRFRFLVSCFSMFLGRFRFLLFRNTRLLASWLVPGKPGFVHTLPGRCSWSTTGSDIHKVSRRGICAP